MLRKSRLAALSIAAALLAAPVLAQVKPVSSVNASGSIAVTNTFQSVLARDANRSGCAIQNNGASNMWVFYGPIAQATKGASVVLQPGYGTSCNSGGIVLTDQVSITGTAGDAFFAAGQ